MARFKQIMFVFSMAASVALSVLFARLFNGCTDAYFSDLFLGMCFVLGFAFVALVAVSFLAEFKVNETEMEPTGLEVVKTKYVVLVTCRELQEVLSGMDDMYITEGDVSLIEERNLYGHPTGELHFEYRRKNRDTQ